MLSSPSRPKLRRSVRDIMETGINIYDDDLDSVCSILDKREESGFLQERSGSNEILSRCLRVLYLFFSTMFLAGSTIVCVWFLTYWVKASVKDETCPVQEWPYPDCSRQLTHKQGNEIPPMYTPEHWNEVRRKYHESVPASRSSLGKEWQNLYKMSPERDGIVVTEHNNGFVAPVDFKYSPGRGRGVYANAVIKKGQKIWDNRYRGVFDSDCSAKVFLNKLTEEERCNAIFWGYSNNFQGKGFKYMMDLDGHAYFNHCSYNEKSRNSEHHYEDELERRDYGLPHFFSFSLLHSTDQATLQRRNTIGSHGLYATRDIPAGEEICFDYHDIHRNVIFDTYSFLFAHALDIHQWFTL
ncbi:expressed unknown protein [Seminavis robusta]|uniref:SET domain-containing protein n=1 Tax=Seminavis robusta TaxID=568900 RepID=A0A9N8EEF6_9STRA|nr:expressed unknown protein [Seminavis robusta]|eukprot:Sro818_g206990.1 n/a (354) ;mRNA; f:37192-38253